MREDISVELDGQIIACAGLQSTHEEGVFLVVSVNVAKDYRGKGFGSVLLKKLCDHADSNGWDLRLTAVPIDRLQGMNPKPGLNQEQLIAFYQKFGFEVVYERTMFRLHRSKDHPPRMSSIYKATKNV